MRLIPFFLALAALAALAACGTKTPLTMPAPTFPAPTSTVDHSNKAAEPRR